MGIRESVKEFLSGGKKVDGVQTPDQAPQPIMTPLNPTDVTQRPVDVANQQQARETQSAQANQSTTAEPTPNQ